MKAIKNHQRTLTNSRIHIILKRSNLTFYVTFLSKAETHLNDME